MTPTTTPVSMAELADALQFIAALDAEDYNPAAAEAFGAAIRLILRGIEDAGGSLLVNVSEEPLSIYALDGQTLINTLPPLGIALHITPPTPDTPWETPVVAGGVSYPVMMPGFAGRVQWPNGAPVSRREIDGLLFVVPVPTSNAMETRDDYYCQGEAVLNAEGQVIGCKGLIW